MVFGNADEYLVTGLQPRLGPAAGDEVQRHGGTRCQNDLVPGGGPDEAGDLAPDGFIEVGRGLGQEMQPTMHIGIGVLIGGHQRVENLRRLLRRSRAVKIDKRLAMNLARQDREIRADGVKIKAAAHAIHHTASLPASQVSATGRSRPARSSFSMVSMVSIRKASISMARAVSKGMPRLVR